MAEKKRKSKVGALRTEVFAMRLDPKLKYLAEIAARKQRRSLANFIEWAMEQALSKVPLSESEFGTSTVADESEKLWALDEPDRLIQLSDNFPELMSYDEQLIYRAINEYSTHSEKFKQMNRFILDSIPKKIDMHNVRSCWEEIKAYALDSSKEEELKAALNESEYNRPFV